MTTAQTDATFPETFAGRKLRELDDAAERLMRECLSSPLITEGQRALAWVAFHKADWKTKMGWCGSIAAYVQQVKAGTRAPRPDVVAAPETESYAATPEVQAVEAAAVQVQQQVEELAEQVEAEFEQVLEATPPPAVTALSLGDKALVPMWQVTQEREALPAAAKWSGKQLPALAQSVQVVRRGRVRRAKVLGYFYAEGFLGVVAEFEGKVPSALRNAPRSQCFFGSDVQTVG